MITEQDRQKYKKNYTEGAILGIKLIEGLQNNVLRELSKEYQKEFGKYFNALVVLMGEKTNRNWIMERVVDEMLVRDMIDELEHTQFISFVIIGREEKLCLK